MRAGFAKTGLVAVDGSLASTVQARNLFRIVSALALRNSPWGAMRSNSTRWALSRRIGSRPVACKARDQDRYGRKVAVCRVGGEDVNAWMVAEGWALV